MDCSTADVPLGILYGQAEVGAMVMHHVGGLWQVLETNVVGFDLYIPNDIC